MTSFQTAEIKLERGLKATPTQVWSALTDEIVEWWPKDFYMGTYDGIEPTGIEMQARVGGQFIEHWGNGEGLLWGTVITVHAPGLLTLVGDSTPQWGGPNRAFTEFRLAASGAAETTLTFTHAPYGVVSEATLDSLKSGWSGLLDHLASWVDDGIHPERPPSVT